MILTERPWTGPIRTFLIQTNWNCNLQEKMRWIMEMDRQDNWKAFATLHAESEIVELTLERKENDLEFTAGKCIKIEHFDVFSRLFYD